MNLQVLNPICDEVNSRSPEGGLEDLAPGQESLEISYAHTKANLTYIFDEWAVENTVDPDPLAIVPIRTARSTVGFAVQFAPVPDSANYKFRWHVRFP